MNYSNRSNKSARTKSHSRLGQSGFQRNSHSAFSYETLEPKVLLAADFASSNSVPDYVSLRTPQVLIADVLLAEQVEVQQNVFAEKVSVPLSTSQDGVWESLSKGVLEQHADKTSLVEASDFNLLQMDEAAIRATLADAPLEFTEGYWGSAVTISVPTPDNSYSSFAVVESPIMEPELAAKFPDIKTYVGYGVDDQGATIRLSMTQNGLKASVRTPGEGAYYVDPYFHLDNSFYMSYFTQDQTLDSERTNVDRALVSNTGELLFSYNAANGEVINNGHDGSESLNLKTLSFGGGAESDDASPPPHGAELRTFRLAVATTGEYTTFHGGSVADGQAAVVEAINRVNQVYETDVAVRLLLVADNDQLIFIDGETDPYTNSSASAMLSQNQATVDSVIGDANYDVGHVFSTSDGGIAALNSIGRSGVKAQGVTGLPSPQGDPFWIDYVAHELGHQYGGNHTFNGCGGAQGPLGYEPGSGTTVMAYAGICGADDVQSNSDAFFHSGSIDEIRSAVTTGFGGAAAAVTGLTNNIPTVDGGVDRVIPAQTPFALTASGSDADAGDVLTYSWEQRNLGPQKGLNAADNGSSPLFRSYLPTTEATRYFPRLAELVNGGTPVGEQLPTTNWSSMDFRVVVRDNVAGGGALNTDDVSIQVVDTGSAFAVTSQNSSTDWEVGATEAITWDVAGTTGSGINAANVDIYFAEDGLNFDTVLATGTPNDGTHDITVPDVSTALGRVMVKASDNIFFSVNTAPILIDVDIDTTEHDSTDVPVDIVDLQTITSTINITDPGEITDLDLRLDITHSWIGDLTAVLTAPNGEEATLFARIANDDRSEDFTDTYFDDSAPTAIADGTAPFTGSFQPQESFAGFAGDSQVGEWTLSISDAANADEGTLNSWSLIISTVSVGGDVGPVTDGLSAADEVLEGAAIGAGVGIVAEASDPDAGDTVSFSLTNDAGGLFAIDADTGVVTVNGALDYETATSHMITVQAMSTDTSTSSADFTIAVLNEDDASLVARNFYYSGSSFDDGSTDGAAPNKSVLLPGETATFENYTSYFRGINGFMIEVEDLNVVPTLATVGDFFEFHVGNDDAPDLWDVAPAPSDLVYENNAAGTTDRVFLTWGDNVIQNTWLEIKLLANASTGLQTEDVFYIGNAIGESGNDPSNAIVNLADVAETRINQTGFGTADITNNFDYNRDGRVNLTDVAIARENQSGFTPINLISPGANGRGVSGGKGGGPAGFSGRGFLIQPIGDPTNEDKGGSEAVLGVKSDSAGQSLRLAGAVEDASASATSNDGAQMIEGGMSEEAPSSFDLLAVELASGLELF